MPVVGSKTQYFDVSSNPNGDKRVVNHADEWLILHRMAHKEPKTARMSHSVHNLSASNELHSVLRQGCRRRDRALHVSASHSRVVGGC